MFSDIDNIREAASSQSPAAAKPEIDTGWYMADGLTEEDRRVPRLVYFCGRIRAEDRPAEFPVRISADGRYKLFVNDTFVNAGPLKGDNHVHYYDEIDIASCLEPGDNSITVCLLVYPENRMCGNHSIFRSGLPRLFFTPHIDWLTYIDRTVSFPPEEEGFSPLWIHEVHEGSSPEKAEAAAVQCSSESLPVHFLFENMLLRDIPFPDRIPHTFGLPAGSIPPHSRKVMVLDAGEEMCAYIKLIISGGAGSAVELLYSECYTGDGGVRTHREDSVRGHLEGYRDVFRISGNGRKTFLPFWFRTFRFVQVTVCTADEPLTVDSFTYEETGYPLAVKSRVDVSDSSLKPVWDISVRTLRRCMHDTYVDCPFYEQLQYIMDTRSEILYTYAVSGDDRLARRAIRDFARAGKPSGLLNCSYPNVNDNVIPGFSLYYIMMVHDHMMYFGDRALIREVMPAIRNILRFFSLNRTPSGLVGKVGGINGESPCWSFIDWAAPWMETTGMPPAGRTGSITMESLLYIMGLEAAADLCIFLSDDSPSEASGEYRHLSEDYRKTAEEVRSAVRTLCVNEEGMITDGPESGDLSQHCQVFGVLSGVLNPEARRRNMLRAMEDTAVTGCSIAMMFYVFRALEKTGLYEYTDRFWNRWRKMIEDGCTTSIEGENYARSECHAWGALALYELPSTILGVRPAAPGYEKIQIRPVPGYLTSAEGTACTPFGDIHISWFLKDGKPVSSIQAADDVLARIVG